MSTPGSNILAQALKVIKPQTLQYFKYLGRTVNSVGQYVTAYEPVVNIRGSFQPVDKKLYAQYGLDLQKDYFTFYTLNNLLDITRDVSNDQLGYQGSRYQCESNVEWFTLDKWKAVLCCRLGAQP